MTYLLAGLASYVFIALKAFQQLNVVRGWYKAIIPFSLAMAFAEVYVIATIAHEGVGLVALPVGFGAGLGAMTSMKIHEIIERRKSSEPG